MDRRRLFNIIMVISVAIPGCSGVTTCLSCTDVIAPSDCSTIERCGPSSTCFTDGYVTEIGYFRYNLGCRDLQQCVTRDTGTTYRPTRVSATLKEFCTECCTGDLCNANGCKTTGFLPRDQRGPICYSCTSQLTTNDCNEIAVCRHDDVCQLKRILFGTKKEIRYETACAFRHNCEAEIQLYQPTAVGRKRSSNNVVIANTCMVQCCTDNLCNTGCTNTTNIPTPVKKPIIDIFQPDQTHAFYPLGGLVKLHCDSSSQPQPTISWFGPNNWVSPTSASSKTLILSALLPSQVGNYTCTARNIYGAASKSILIISNVTGAIDCDFESTCLWKNNPNDDGDWINSGTLTHNNVTNKNMGNKFGDSTGHFLFVKSDSNKESQVVDLISPELGQSGNACLSFLYQMLNGSKGFLQVEVVAFCENDALCDIFRLRTVLLHIPRTNKTGWHLAQIPVPAIPYDHRIIIKSIYRYGLFGNSAIDNISYIDSSCKPTLSLNGSGDSYISVNANTVLELTCGVRGNPKPTYTWKKYGGCGSFQNSSGAFVLITDHATPGNAGTYVCSAINTEPDPAPLTQTFHVTVNNFVEELCTFENGMCGWMQDVGDDFDWTLNSGPTLSKFTGPSTDHTFSNASGNYLYVETSSPRKLGDTAVLRSYTLKGNHSACFSFYYHMFGNDTGQLNVSLMDTCTGQKTSVFSASGNKGDKWWFQSINITALSIPRDYFIQIEAVDGVSYHGDIAIDDVLIKDSFCK